MIRLPIGSVPLSADYWKCLDASSEAKNPIVVSELPTKSQRLMWANNQLQGIPLGEILYNFFLSITNHLAKNTYAASVQSQQKYANKQKKLFVRDCNYWITGYDFPPHPISSCRLFEHAPAVRSQKRHWQSLLGTDLSNGSKFCLHLSIRSASGWVQN